MILSFHPCFVTECQIILGSRSLGSPDLQFIDEAEAIILPQSCSEELYRHCARSDALIFPDYRVRFQYPGKTGQSILFKETGTPLPETEIWGSADDFRQSIRNNSIPHEFPFLLKADKGHEGEGIHLIEDHQTLDTSLDSLKILEDSGSGGFISQELIPAEGNVLRVVIMGQGMITYWKRPEHPGQTITTASKNGIIDKEWRQDLQDKGKVEVRRFSEKTGINLAAIDCIFPVKTENPEPLLLEINYYFGRRGLGGSINYYGLLFQAIQYWLAENDLDPGSVSLI